MLEDGALVRAQNAQPVVEIGGIHLERMGREAERLTQEVLDQYDMGIKVEQVILQDVNPPDPVKPAVNELNAAKQEQEELINNAEREYNKIIPAARGKAEQMIANAKEGTLN